MPRGSERRAPSGTIVVVGDALLDVDLVGTASRLTPDAPVTVVEDVDTRERPGGAALAASDLDFLVVRGRRGGSAITAAAVNAIASESE